MAVANVLYTWNNNRMQGRGIVGVRCVSVQVCVKPYRTVCSFQLCVRLL